MPGKIILFIASEKGYTAFSAVVMQNYAHKIGAVVTFKETDVAKSWDNDIREECIHSKIPFYFWADIKNNMFAVMQEHDCKYAVTISWKYLLPVEIYDFVRAVGSPYPGAFTFLNGEKIYIKRTEIAEDLKFIIRDCGKIWRIADNQPEVICGKGILRIVSAAYEDGEGVAFHRVRCRLK